MGKVSRAKKIISKQFMDDAVTLFFNNSRVDTFYNKLVYFSEGCRGNRFSKFQIIGYLGGIPSDTDYSSETSFYIVSDSLYEDLSRGSKAPQIIELEKRLNSKGNNYAAINIVTENAFLSYVRERCARTNDITTAKLLKELL